MSADHFICDSVNMSIRFHANVTFSMRRLNIHSLCLLLFVDVGSYLMCCAPNVFINFVNGLWELTFRRHCSIVSLFINKLWLCCILFSHFLNVIAVQLRCFLCTVSDWCTSFVSTSPPHPRRLESSSTLRSESEIFQILYRFMNLISSLQ